VADPREVLNRRAPEPTMTLRYGDEPDHVADVWLRSPVSVPAAVSHGPTLVLVLHGGFWRSEYGRSIAGPMSAALRDEGYVVAAVEYRRTGGAGGWPRTCDDVAAACRALPDLIASAAGAELGGAELGGAELGGAGFGPVVLVGHSAGGHLALWAGSQVALPRDGLAGSGLAGVVSLGGVCDLGRADELALDPEGDSGAVAALLGGRRDEVPERYAAADPMQLPPPPCPVVLIHGLDDRIVPVDLSRRYASYARSAGADLRLVELPGVEHFAPIDPQSTAWPTVLAEIRALAAP
jgi:acetyl esterase/lipase